MSRRILAAMTFIALLGGAFQGASGQSTQPASQPSRQVLKGNGFAVAVPAGWRVQRDMQPTMPLYISGDGRGLPALDETGQPLQIGMTIEHWPTVKVSLEERLKSQNETLKKDTRLEPVGAPIVQSIKLDDETPATLMIVELIKEKRRRSLQIKVLTNGPDGSAWCSAGFLVGGLDSKLPVADSRLAQWLLAHVRSISFDASKLNEGKLPGRIVPNGATP